MIPGRRYTPEDALKIARRRWWVLAVPILIAAVAGAAVALSLPKKYRSETLIFVVPQRVPDSYVKSTVTTRFEDRLQSIRQQIMSRTRLERIITEFDLYPQARKTMTLEDLVPFMRTQINVQLVRDDAFSVSYVSEDPDTAQKVTRRLASLVIDETMRDRENIAEGTGEFLETQLEEARARLVEHEKKLEVYRRAHIGELPTQAESNMQAVQTLQAQSQGLSDSIQRDRDRLFVVERELADLPSRIQSGVVVSTTAAPAPTQVDSDGLPLGSASERLAAARANLRVAETRLKPEHPDIIRLKSAIRDLEAKAAEEQKAAKAGQPIVTAAPSQAAIREAQLNDERAMLQRQVQQKEQQINTLHGQIGAYQAKLDAMPTRESEMIAMTRDYDILKKIYDSLLAKREDSKVAANLERRQIGEQFKILDPANRPERPFSPNRRLIAAAALGLGAALGVGIILLLEVTDRSFRSDVDVQQALGLPVLAMIPHMWNTEERQRRRRLMLWSASAAVVVLGVAAVFAMRWLQR